MVFLPEPVSQSTASGVARINVNDNLPQGMDAGVWHIHWSKHNVPTYVLSTFPGDNVGFGVQELIDALLRVACRTRLVVVQPSAVTGQVSMFIVNQNRQLPRA